MNEEEIALGTLLSANYACHVAFKRLAEDSHYAVEGSRFKTFTGVSSREIKQAQELTEQAIRLLDKAVARMRRYHEQKEEG